MITSKQIAELKTASLLSGTFAIDQDSVGEKWVAIGNLIVDLKILKMLLLWKMSDRNTSYMWNHYNKTKLVEFLKNLNPSLCELDTDYKILSKVVYTFHTLTSEQTKRDLINRYKQVVID